MIAQARVREYLPKATQATSLLEEFAPKKISACGLSEFLYISD